MVFVMPSTGRVSPWILRDAGCDADGTPQGRVQVSDNILGVVSLAPSGMGICQTYDSLRATSLRRGARVIAAVFDDPCAAPATVVRVSGDDQLPGRTKGLIATALKTREEVHEPSLGNVFVSFDMLTAAF